MLIIVVGGGGGGVLFFFNDTATTEIYTLSLHDALLICRAAFHNAVAMVRRCFVDGAVDLFPAPCGGGSDPQIGRAHVLNPVTSLSRMPSSA